MVCLESKRLRRQVTVEAAVPAAIVAGFCRRGACHYRRSTGYPVSGNFLDSKTHILRTEPGGDQINNMQIKSLTFLSLSFISLALADDFKTLSGKEYKDATVSRVEPDGLVLTSKTGISKVYFTELPKDVQERFGYDPQKAGNYSAQQSAGFDQVRKQQEETSRQKAEASQKADQYRAEQANRRNAIEMLQSSLRGASETRRPLASSDRRSEEARTRVLGWYEK